MCSKALQEGTYDEAYSGS